MNEKKGRPPAVVSGPVCDALAALGHATPPQIKEWIGDGVTLQQVRKALSNAIALKRVRSTRFVRQQGIRGGRMATYWLAGNPPPKDFKPAAPKPEPDDAAHVDVDTSWMFKPNRRDHQPSFAYPSVWHYARGEPVATQQARP